MAKRKISVPKVYSLEKKLNDGEIKPIYFLFGEDKSGIDEAAGKITDSALKIIESDFDHETITVEKGTNANELLDLILAYPFGGGKKFVHIKNFDLLKDYKLFADIFENPPEFSILLIEFNGGISNLHAVPFKHLCQKDFIFESSELKYESEVIEWLKFMASKMGLKLNSENAKVIYEISGSNKSLLIPQLNNFKDYLNGSDEITIEVIEKLSSTTKEFNIFDLLNVLGKGNKSESLKVAFNLIDQGVELIFILSMLTKFTSTIMQSLEIKKIDSNFMSAAKKIGVSGYYYKNCLAANYFMNEKRLLRTVKALLEADLAIKTSSANSKDIITILISSILR